MMSRLRQIWGSITGPLQAYRDVRAKLYRKFSSRVFQRVDCMPDDKPHREPIATSQCTMNDEICYISPSFFVWKDSYSVPTQSQLYFLDSEVLLLCCQRCMPHARINDNQTKSWSNYYHCRINIACILCLLSRWTWFERTSTNAQHSCVLMISGVDSLQIWYRNNSEMTTGESPFSGPK